MPPAKVPPPCGLGSGHSPQEQLLGASFGYHCPDGFGITGEMIPLGKFRGNSEAAFL